MLGDGSVGQGSASQDWGRQPVLLMAGSGPKGESTFQLETLKSDKETLGIDLWVHAPAHALPPSTNTDTHRHIWLWASFLAIVMRT